MVASKSPPSRAAWIEIPLWQQSYMPNWSPPSRAAWIEISHKPASTTASWSPPSRAAWIEIASPAPIFLAPSSRRLHGRRGLKSARIRGQAACMLSPPSRAAWIEISPLTPLRRAGTSPPSRAAWIEILREAPQVMSRGVAAFTGGVD